MDLEKSLSISAAGMRAQGTRLRVISENIANANSTAQTHGGEPYRRKLVTFDNEPDRPLAVETVRVDSIVDDRRAFSRPYAPGQPAADADRSAELRLRKECVSTCRFQWVADP